MKYFAVSRLRRMSPFSSRRNRMDTFCGWRGKSNSPAGRLLGPPIDLIAWASSKDATCRRLALANVPVPDGGKLLAGQPLARRNGPFPIVLKPDQGAGAESVLRVPSLSALNKVRPSRFDLRVETWCEGQPASVAVLLSSGQSQILQPCLQFFERWRRVPLLWRACPGRRTPCRSCQKIGGAGAARAGWRRRIRGDRHGPGQSRRWGGRCGHRNQPAVDNVLCWSASGDTR